MKYQVVSGCVIQGYTGRVGEIVEIDDATAKILLGLGRIVPASQATSVIENRAVGVEVAEKPKRRAYKKAAVDVEPESEADDN